MAAERSVAAKPRISVIIPTFERRALVVEAVRALAAQEDAPPFEVVVVVDGSTDGTAEALRELARDFPLTVIEQPNNGCAAARNRGADASHGEVLLFLDDDMEADTGLLREHERSHAEGYQVVFGDIPLHPDSPKSFLADAVGEWADARADSLSQRPTDLDVTDFLTGQMSVRRDLFMVLDGFDTTFTRGGTFGGADFDFGVRLSELGCPMVFNPKAVSRQRYVVSPQRYLRQWYDNGGARVLLARRYPESIDRLLDGRERLADRYVWRWIRRPRRSLALRLVRGGAGGPRTIRFFRRVRDLEFWSGIRAAGGRPARHAVRVLCYHSISSGPASEAFGEYAVAPDRFRNQLASVKRWCHFIDGAEFVRYLAGAGVPRRAALLTFDDCFRDLRDEAEPIMAELGIPAVAFAVTQLIGGESEWTRRRGATMPLLDEEGLKDLAARRVTIGSHGRTHVPLDGVSATVLEDELFGSAADLEARGLRRPELLAYPHGQHGEAVAEAAQRAGYRGAFTTGPGLARPEGASFAIPRIEILRSDGRLRFAWKVATGRRSRHRMAGFVRRFAAVAKTQRPSARGEVSG